MRIDHIYNSTSNRRNSLSIALSILLGFFLSNHTHVVARALAPSPCTRPSIYRMNTSHLKEPTLCGKLNQHWSVLQEEFRLDLEKVYTIFFKGLYSSCQMTRTYGKDQARIIRARGNELHDNLAVAQIALESRMM